MLFNIVNLVYRNIDKLLIGKCFGMVELGYYEKSYRLMMLPLENVSNVITPVLHPILSEYQNDVPFIYSKYKTLVSFLAWIGFPLSAFLYYSSSEIILLLFGEQWEASIPVFQILSLSVGLQLVQSAIGSIYQVTNQVKKMFVVSFFINVFNFVGSRNRALLPLASIYGMVYCKCFFYYICDLSFCIDKVGPKRKFFVVY